jgi:hypothetical protein
MSLLVLMYHRARAGAHGNAPEMLDAHFALVAKYYQNVLPGEDLASGRLNVCLTFDDAYFDFYARVFPLLKKHGLRAVLAVAPLFVRETIEAPIGERMGLSVDEAFAQPARGGFCTWGELCEMVRSGRVQIAAHGYSHCRLDKADTDLTGEIEVPQRMLADRLGAPVESFAFPYGRYSAPALRRTRARYRHVFRIGGASNASWSRRLLYRVDADRMEAPESPFAPARLMRYRARYFWNRLRRC